MDPAIYPLMRKIEGRHWWFVVRRRILHDMLATIKLPKNADILDAGCGTGGNLDTLSQYGKVTGLEMEQSAANFAKEREVADIIVGYLPDNIPIPNKSFDLVTMVDVLEHIDDDAGSLSAVNSLLKDTGYILITVPAFQSLWSVHDEVHHHKRRYRKRQLTQLIEQSGFKIQYISYFNTWLFPVAAFVRLISKILPMPNAGGGDDLPGSPINSILMFIFNTERTLLKWMRLPFGLSLIAIARKE